jgi:hypothetical protein
VNIVAQKLGPFAKYLVKIDEVMRNVKGAICRHQISLGVFLTNIELPEFSWGAIKRRDSIFYSSPG